MRKGRKVLESIGVRARPTWVRGPARIEGEEIVLDTSSAEEYTLSHGDNDVSLLFDLGNLRNLGNFDLKDPNTRLVDAVRITNAGIALEFAASHGFLWYGPARVGSGEIRESLKDWFFDGHDLSIGTAMYLELRRSLLEGSPEPIRSYLRTLRDGRIFGHIPLPDAYDDLLEYASIQLAENITRGMAECAPTLSAACGLLKDGEKVGGAGDFRFGNEPRSLVGAAYYQLALLVSRKEPVRECEQCKRPFVPTDPRQIEHKKCGNLKRQRELRKRRRSG
jgi:hypothetical protein